MQTTFVKPDGWLKQRRLSFAQSFFLRKLT